jgi:hypothetical protein
MARLKGVKVIDMVDGDVTKISYEGADYVKVDEPKAEDIGLRVRHDLPRIAKIGNYYAITQVNRGKTNYIDEEGDEPYTGTAENFVYFRKVNAPTIDERVTALEHDVAELKDARVKSLQVGDYAKVIKNSYDTMSGFAVGDIVKIIENPPYEDDELRIEHVKHVDFNYTGYAPYIGYLVRATDEEVAQANAELEPKLKVGDYAKVIDGVNPSVKNGDIIKIYEICKDGERVRFTDVNGNKIAGCKRLEWLVRATDEEVEKARAEAQSIAKWVSIGRKPNEFKKGDIVRVVKEGKPSHTSVYKEGDIGVIISAYGTNRPVVDANDVPQLSCVELIAPVEARVDRDGL